MNARCPRCGHQNEPDEVQCEKCGEILRPAKDGLRSPSLHRVLFTEQCPPPNQSSYTLDASGPGRWRPTRGLLCQWILAAVVLGVSGAGLAAFGPLSVNHGPTLFLAGLWALAGAGALMLGGAGVWLAMLLAHWIEEKFPRRRAEEEPDDEPERASPVPLRERKIFAPRAATVSARAATTISPGPATSAGSHAAPPVSPLSSSAASAASAEGVPASPRVSPAGLPVAIPAYPHAWWPRPRPHSLPLTVAASVLVLVAVYLTAIAFAPLVGGQALLALVPVTVVAAVVLVLAHIFGNHRGVPAAALVVSLAGLFIAAANLWLLDALSEAARREADRTNARIEQRIDDTAKAIREELAASAATPTATPSTAPLAQPRQTHFGMPPQGARVPARR